MKRIIPLVLTLIFGLTGCSLTGSTSAGNNTAGNNSNTSESSPLEDWLNSDKKTDYNKDGTIDSKDYAIFVEYEKWLDGNDALDYNGDRKINYEDYSIFVSYSDWKKSDDSIDFNEDSKITFEDYEEYLNYLEWLDSDDAVNLDENETITVDDYLLFKSEDYQNYYQWKQGKTALDYDGDGEINEDDYELYLAYAAWLNSDKSSDLNDDRVINYNDYLISLDSSMTDYEKWLLSNNAKDYNGDEKIDEKDYNTFNLFGMYKVKDLVIEDGIYIYFAASNIFLEDFGLYLNDFSFTFSEDGIEYSLSQDLLSKLASKDQETIGNIFDSMKLVSLSNKLISLDFTVYLNVTKVDLSIYFELGNDGLWRTLFRFQYVKENIEEPCVCTVSFAIERMTDEA